MIFYSNFRRRKKPTSLPNFWETSPPWSSLYNFNLENYLFSCTNNNFQREGQHHFNSRKLNFFENLFWSPSLLNSLYNGLLWIWNTMANRKVKAMNEIELLYYWYSEFWRNCYSEFFRLLYITKKQVFFYSLQLSVYISKNVTVAVYI